MLSKTGVPEKLQVEKALPRKERRAAGPVVIVECFQEIPCDPCYTSCRQGCFLPFDDINDLPRMDFEKCNGCGICVGACPGLAIFIVDESYAEKEALLSIPWEFLPVPLEGEVVEGLDREGGTVARVKVKKVRPSAKKSTTHIVTLVVPKEYAHEIRSMKVIR